MKSIRTILTLSALAAGLALTSCTVTFDPAGAKSVSVDPGAAVAIGKIIADK